MVNLRSALSWADSSKQIDKKNAKSNRQKKKIEKQRYFVVQEVTDDIDLNASRMISQGWSVNFYQEGHDIVCRLTRLHESYSGQGRNLDEAFKEAKSTMP